MSCASLECTGAHVCAQVRVDLLRTKPVVIYHEDVHESEDNGQNWGLAIGCCNLNKANLCQILSDSSDGTASGSTLSCSRISLRNELLLVLDRIPYRDRLNKSLVTLMSFSI